MNTKHAVCVGINYPGTSAQLSGCVNDALEWSDLLEAEGYGNRDVLLDAGATKENIVELLEDAVARARFGDRIVFTYSGHGTWIPDYDGDEGDRRDEALCPIDYARGNLITDDELDRIFGRARFGVGILVISDSCHSGTVNRAMTGVVPSMGVPRFLPPHELGLVSPEKAVRMEETSKGAPRKTTSLISGCTDLEYSYDAWFGSRANGAFTRRAIDTYGPGISLKAWFNRIRGGLPSDQYPQTPQLSAASQYRKYGRAL